MGSRVSTITSKWQITLPEEVRKEIALRIGQRIVWQVEGEKLVGRRVRSVKELAGCLKCDDSNPREAGSSAAFGEAAVERHDRLSRAKP